MVGDACYICGMTGLHNCPGLSYQNTVTWTNPPPITWQDRMAGVAERIVSLLERIAERKWLND